jgi:hypothetical protein
VLKSLECSERGLRTSMGNAHARSTSLDQRSSEVERGDRSFERDVKQLRNCSPDSVSAFASRKDQSISVVRSSEQESDSESSSSPRSRQAKVSSQFLLGGCIGANSLPLLPCAFIASSPASQIRIPSIYIFYLLAWRVCTCAAFSSLADAILGAAKIGGRQSG